MLSLVAIAMGVVVAFAAATPTVTKQSSGNPDDNTNYITVTTDGGLTVVKHKLVEGSGTLSLGTVRKAGDYMYVYGYYYTGTAAPNTSITKVTDSTANWAKQTGDIGWGCVAISKTKTSYADPAGALEGAAVTWMNNAYRNCTALVTTNGAGECWGLPRIPSTVKHTDYMFGGCTGLVRASLTTASTLTANTFAGCTNLTRLFIGKNLKTAVSGAIGTVASGCQIYLDGTNTYTSGWNSGKTVNTNQDILLWALD